MLQRFIKEKESLAERYDKKHKLLLVAEHVQSEIPGVLAGILPELENSKVAVRITYNSWWERFGYLNPEQYLAIFVARSIGDVNRDGIRRNLETLLNVIVNERGECYELTIT